MEQCDDADFTFPVFYDMKEHVVYVKKRPHVHMFLQKMAKMFEVVIFTASQSVYANQLLDVLDPENKLFSKRFFRESCLFTDSGYTKDLTVVGVDLAKVAIIDNTPQVKLLLFIVTFMFLFKLKLFIAVFQIMIDLSSLFVLHRVEVVYTCLTSSVLFCATCSIYWFIKVICGPTNDLNCLCLSGFPAPSEQWYTNRELV